MQILRLAKELGVKSFEIVEKCKLLGIEKERHLDNLSEEEEQRIREAFADGSSENSGTIDAVSDEASVPSSSGEIESSTPTASRVKDSVDTRASRSRGDTSDVPKGSRVCLMGVQKSGKTAFWAVVIERSLTIGFPEIAAKLSGWRPDVPPGEQCRIAKEICARLRRGEDLTATALGEFRGFFVRFCRRHHLILSEEYTFASHDLAGENIKRWVEDQAIPSQVLKQFSDAVGQARGLIILIDPTRGQDHIEDQDYVWRLLIDRLSEEQGRRFRKKPVLFAISKCDAPGVRDQLAMPTPEERISGAASSQKLREQLKRQDMAALRFVQNNMPKLWRVIDKRDKLRKLRRCRVIAISSTGMAEELGTNGRLAPWRVLEPFRWMLEQLRPMRRVHPWLLVRLPLLTVFATVMFALFGKSHLETRQHLLDVERRAGAIVRTIEEDIAARRGVDPGDVRFNRASAILGEADGLRSVFHLSGRRSRLLERLGELEIEASICQLLEGEDFSRARDYVVQLEDPRQKQFAVDKFLVESRRWMDDRMLPLVVEGVWRPTNYESIARLAAVTEGVGAMTGWAATYSQVARIRKSLTEVYVGAALPSGGLSLEDCISRMDEIYGRIPELSQTEYLTAVRNECEFVIRQGLLPRADYDIGEVVASTPCSVSSLLDASQVEALLVSRPWVPAESKGHLLHQEYRMAILASLHDGRPDDGINLFEQFQGEAQEHDLVPSDMACLNALATACRQACEMAFVPAGRYSLQVSSPVLLECFYIDKHEVTIQQFWDFVQATQYVPSGTPGGGSYVLDLWDPRGRASGMSAEYVTPQDAMAYARHRGVRLPTQEEWMIAAGWDPKRDRLRVYPYGGVFDLARTSIDRSTGAEGESPLGCADMAGLQWELTINSTGDGFILKGGCGQDLSDLGENQVRDSTKVMYERPYITGSRAKSFGFRCVLSPKDIKEN